MRNSRTLTQNFSTSLGNDSQKIGPLKNASWTRGQPGELTTTKASSPKTTTVETTAIRHRARAFTAEPEPGPWRRPRRRGRRRSGQGPVGFHGLRGADRQGWKTGAPPFGRELLAW